VTQCKVSEHAGCGRKRDSNQQPDEAEQIAKGKQCKNQPYRVNSNTFSDQFGCKHVAFDKLTDKENSEHDKDHSVGRPELCDRHPKRQHEARHGSDIKDKCDEAGNEADEQAEIESGESERARIKSSQG